MTKIFNKYKNQHLRAALRGRMTKSEVVLWKFIQNDQLGYRFRRQYGIGNYIIDFYCPKLKLAIELDGFTHGEESVYNKDVIKQKYLESNGIFVKRYNDEQVYNNLTDVLFDIEFTCKQLGKPFASANSPSPPLGKRGIAKK